MLDEMKIPVQCYENFCVFNVMEETNFKEKLYIWPWFPVLIIGMKKSFDMKRLLNIWITTPSKDSTRTGETTSDQQVVGGWTIAEIKSEI